MSEPDISQRLIDALDELQNEAVVYHYHEPSDERLMECRLCGEWEAHHDRCPMPAIAQWLGSPQTPVLVVRPAHHEEDGSYLSVPAMPTRKRRLFTFTNPLLLSHDGSIVATAAEGIEDDDNLGGAGMRFLIFDAVWDGKVMQRIQQDGVDAVLGVWVSNTVIASEQVQATSLTHWSEVLDAGRREP